MGYLNAFVGCQTPGFFGENCSIPCPQNCQEDHCNIVDGTCLGCTPGYIGSECDEGTFNNDVDKYDNIIEGFIEK